MGSIPARDFDVAVIGGGPAGMGAALAAHKTGANVVIIERNDHLGGILRQCIHPGFGLTHFKEELTGPEYAQRFIDQVAQTDIEVMLGSMVLSIDGTSEAPMPGTSACEAPTCSSRNPREGDTRAGKPTCSVDAHGTTAPDATCAEADASELMRTTGHTVRVMTESGMVDVRCRSVVLAMGCRERTRSEIKIPGSRPAGVFTAGLAQRYINIENLRPGHRVVILGSGDIGLIMARRCALEGIEVEGVYELMPYANGLHRNVKNCLEDFDIPLHLSTTVTRVIGRNRVEGVEVTRVDENLAPIPGTERIVACDTLLLSVGLIPENEIACAAGVELDPRTRGARVDQDLQTNVPGIFSCGNVLHVHDLADNVTAEAERAGAAAAAWAAACAEAQGTNTDAEPCAIRVEQADRRASTDSAPIEEQSRTASEKATTPTKHDELRSPLTVEAAGMAGYVVPARISAYTNTKLFFRVKRPVGTARIVISSGDEVLFAGKPRSFKPSIMESVPLTRRMIERATGSITLSVDPVEEM